MNFRLREPNPLSWRKDSYDMKYENNHYEGLGEDIVRKYSVEDGNEPLIRKRTISFVMDRINDSKQILKLI